MPCYVCPCGRGVAAACTGRGPVSPVFTIVHWLNDKDDALAHMMRLHAESMPRRRRGGEGSTPCGTHVLLSG
jgi:hypothetical protein